MIRVDFGADKCRHCDETVDKDDIRVCLSCRARVCSGCRTVTARGWICEDCRFLVPGDE